MSRLNGTSLRTTATAYVDTDVEVDIDLREIVQGMADDEWAALVKAYRERRLQSSIASVDSGTSAQGDAEALAPFSDLDIVNARPGLLMAAQIRIALDDAADPIEAVRRLV